MNLAILFWFYKDPLVVANRLLAIRKLNRGIPVFGLYGGEHAEIERFRRSTELLDDLWVHPEVDPEWAWHNGDIMLAGWFHKRGHQLDWQQIFIHQWDLLTTLPASNFLTSDQNKILITGLRPLEDVASHWVWVQPWSVHYKKFQAFCDHPFIKGHPIWASVFVFATLTRRFLSDYGKTMQDIPGFFEYRMPTVARILGYQFVRNDVHPDWGDRGDPLLNGCQREVTLDQVHQRLVAKKGVGVFHPVYSIVRQDQILTSLMHSRILATHRTYSQVADRIKPRNKIAVIQVPPARPEIASGGSQVVSMALAQGLAGAGHRVVLFSGTNGKVSTGWTSDGIQCRSSYQLTRQILEHGTPKIRFFPEDWRLLGESRVAFMFDRVYPLPARVEAILVLGTTAYGFAHSAILSRGWSKMIVPSQYVFREVSAALESSGQTRRIKRVYVIANPVEPVRLGLLNNASIKRPRGSRPLRLLFPHRSDRGKGIEACLRLLSRLARYRDTVLTVVMDGSPTSEFGFYTSAAEFARSLGVLDMLEFTPWHPMREMGELYGSADLTLCIGCITEGFGLVCLESILCGTPVIARSAGAQAQLLPPHHGCVVAPEKEEDLEQVVRDLLSDPVLPDQLSRGREFIEREFSLRSFLAGFRSVAEL